MDVQDYLLILTIFGSLFSTIVCETKDDYTQKRNDIISHEKSRKLGGNINYTDKEKLVNTFLMKLKLKEIYFAKDNDTIYPPARHFFTSKPYIERSQVFKIIRSMPKGAALHIHDSSIAGINWLIQRATYDPNCYMCYDKGLLNFHFFPKPPREIYNKKILSGAITCNWQQVNLMRKKHGDPQEFDQLLYNSMSMIVPNPREAYKTEDQAWAKFDSIFTGLLGLFTYAPIFKDYYTQALKEFYEDNVQYTEIRVLLPPVYELDGTVHDIDWGMAVYQNLTDQFRKKHPDFIGSKIIYTNIRNLDKSVITQGIKDSIRFLKKFPRTFAGYDLVGQEDPGHSLFYFIDELLYPSQNGIPLKYFFHAGETNWQDLAVDVNLIDAVLLNTTRIGHGYAALKHPKVLEIIKEKNIAIEVNPISNQVLMLVDDLRNHPAAFLMAEDYPVVISSDDPALWGAQGLSYDFYEAFMGLGGAWADLGTLKKLAINSIQYSALNPTEKKKAMLLWQQKWSKFIDQTIRLYRL